MSAASLSHPGAPGANGHRTGAAPPPLQPDRDATRPSAAAALPRVAILGYHRFGTASDDEMTVRIATFRTHVAGLRDNGFAGGPLREVVAWRHDGHAPIPPKTVALTVDDGHPSVRDLLAPVVLHERLPVTLFVHPPAVAGMPQMLGWDDLRTLRHTTLFDVQPYMWWYPDLAAMERLRAPDTFRAFVLAQFGDGREQIRQRLGGDADLLAWAPGLCDEELIGFAKQSGYVAGFTLDARRVTPEAQTFALPRFPMVDRCTPAMLGRLLGETTDAA